MTRPIVFCTDYGLADGFVGVCHGVIARIAPDARVIDLTHAVPRQDVLRRRDDLAGDAVHAGRRGVRGGGRPRVGSERRSIAVRTAAGPLLVGPDNGLLSLAWEALRRGRLPPRSRTSA